MKYNYPVMVGVAAHMHWLHDYTFLYKMWGGSVVQLTSFLTWYLRGSCGRDYEDYRLLGCVAMQSGRCLLACQRNVLPSSSRYSSTMEMKAANSSETMINIYQITSHTRSNPVIFSFILFQIPLFQFDWVTEMWSHFPPPLPFNTVSSIRW
jgi:hypothetical protein